MLLLIIGIITTLAGIWLMKTDASPVIGSITLITGILVAFIGSMRKRKKGNERKGNS